MRTVRIQTLTAANVTKWSQSFYKATRASALQNSPFCTYTERWLSLSLWKYTRTSSPVESTQFTEVQRIKPKLKEIKKKKQRKEKKRRPMNSNKTMRMKQAVGIRRTIFVASVQLCLLGKSTVATENRVCRRCFVLLEDRRRLCAHCDQNCRRNWFCRNERNETAEWIKRRKVIFNKGVVALLIISEIFLVFLRKLSFADFWGKRAQHNSHD